MYEPFSYFMAGCVGLFVIFSIMTFACISTLEIKSKNKAIQKSVTFVYISLVKNTTSLETQWLQQPLPPCQLYNLHLINYVQKSSAKIKIISF